ncbi:neural-cadherin-like [Penaeus vannamei]|uniref:Neural-cadherin-like n=1 Tax=Penaeus vannamei TaxID=6689 RepID=A0A423SX07_PENVA|nr:neural-cadherin-like [Penaeus vannamei]
MTPHREQKSSSSLQDDLRAADRLLLCGGASGARRRRGGRSVSVAGGRGLSVESERQCLRADVTQVAATDYDDAAEGSNAVVSYSVEKNVIDDQSGQPIFAIDASTGRITTALCCLDRERTSSYTIHVVASDGGGLKGTGTVLVRVGDENDVSPRFSKREWRVTVHESVAANTSLATLTVLDPDASNDFAFRVVEGSGHGWDKFHVTAAGNRSGSLQAVEELDYEDPRQRQGFRFKVQVSDKGAEGWREAAQLDWAWVVVDLLDDNDNAPDLSNRQVNLTLPEDTPIGHLLASFTAHDRDQGGAGGALQHRARKRPRPPLRGGLGGARAAAAPAGPRGGGAPRGARAGGGRGAPPRTATATLSLSLTDVNDNAPHVARRDPILVPENTRPGHVAALALDDPDDWSLGHGPPFTARLDDNAAPDIKNTFAVEFDQSRCPPRPLGRQPSLFPRGLLGLRGLRAAGACISAGKKALIAHKCAQNASDGFFKFAGGRPPDPEMIRSVP